MSTTVSSTLVKHLQSAEPPYLYHYTTQAGLLGIIEGRKLRATKVHYMNDSTEFRASLKMLDNYLTTIELTNTDIVSTPPHTGLTLRKQIALRALKSTASIENINICVACFCNDGDLLSQWRGYAGDYGFAIGFKTEELKAYGNRANFTLQRCIYDKDTQERIIREVSEHYLGDDIIQNTPQNKLAAAFLDAIVDCGALFKNILFSEEKEWRLVSSPVDTRNLEFRQGRSMIIPYSDIPMDGSSLDTPIDHVIVGPCPNIELSVASVETLLMREKIGEQTVAPPGIKAKVAPSKIPYRNTV
jgi:Protein of unknown function (DUF2971)